MKMSTKDLVDVESFAIEIRIERRILLACCLKKDADEKRIARELLDQQIPGCFAGGDVLAARHVLDQHSSFVRVELSQAQDVEQFKVALGFVSRGENLATQTGKDERETAASKHSQHFRS